MKRRFQAEQCSWLGALGSGLVGAATLTAIHEAARRGVVAHPPRMDTLGRRAIASALGAAGQDAKPRAERQRWALASDIVANTLYYAAIARGRGRARWGRAVVLGIAAGVGAMMLPPYIGLGRPPNGQYTSTQIMTLTWYLAGALASAAAASYLSAPRQDVGPSREVHVRSLSATEP